MSARHEAAAVQARAEDPTVGVPQTAERSSSSGGLTVRIKVLIHCLAIGGTQHLTQPWWAPVELHQTNDDLYQIHLDAARLSALKEDWRKKLGRSLTAEELRASLASTVDEEILLAEAMRKNLHRTDVIVRRRLKDNLAFTQQDLHVGEDPLELAYKLGMVQTDAVVRRRLVMLMQAQLRSQIVTDDTPLSEFGNSTETQSFSFAHVLLPRGADKAQALSQLSRDEALRFSQPFLAGNEFENLSKAEMDAQFGPGFSAQLLKQSQGVWVGPVTSSHGKHWVWIDRIQTRTLQPDASKLQYAWLANQEELALLNGIRGLRERYTVTMDKAQ